MKAIIQAYSPKEIERIARGEQTVKVCKTAPKDTPFKVYMYCTCQKVNGEILLTYDKKIEGRNRGFRDNGDIPLAGKVVGEYVCERVDNIVPSASRYMINNDIAYTNKVAKGSCLYFNDLKKYLGNKVGRALHISDLKIYDKPKELGEFIKVCPIKNQDCAGCEFYSDYSGSCTNYVTRPPRGWRYVEEL